MTTFLLAWGAGALAATWLHYLLVRNNPQD